MVRTLVCRLLEEWGFKAVEADNGRTALQLARKLNGGLSMVISDLSMPIWMGTSSLRLSGHSTPTCQFFSYGQVPYDARG